MRSILVNRRASFEMCRLSYDIRGETLAASGMFKTGDDSRVDIQKRRKEGKEDVSPS